MVQLGTVIFHILLYSSSLCGIMCLNETNKEVGEYQNERLKSLYSINKKLVPGLHGDRPRRRPINHHSDRIRPKKGIHQLNNNKEVIKDEGGLVKNVSALPTNGEYDHTHRPGSVVWKTPKPKLEQAQNDKDVILGPIYRLPLDHDDTGAQIQMEWSYTHLKVRPENITIEAVGPNKGIWSVTVVEGSKTTATWDLRETPSYSPLIEGQYTLYLYDQRGRETKPKPGWLLPDDKMKISLYKTVENNHVGEYIAPSECATCYKHIMQGLGKLENSTVNNKHTNLDVMYILLSFLWFLV